MTEFVFIYTTSSSREEAGRIARTLVEGKLAACVNIVPGMTSVYRWEGEVQEASEFIVIVKTRADLFDKVAARIRELHAYKCPCIVALPVVAGTGDFLNWIRESTEKLT